MRGRSPRAISGAPRPAVPAVWAVALLALVSAGVSFPAASHLTAPGPAASASFPRPTISGRR